MYDKFTSILNFFLLLFYPYPYREPAKGKNFENPLYFAPLKLREYEVGLRGEKGIFVVHPIENYQYSIKKMTLQMCPMDLSLRHIFLV